MSRQPGVEFKAARVAKQRPEAPDQREDKRLLQLRKRLVCPLFGLKRLTGHDFEEPQHAVGEEGGRKLGAEVAASTARSAKRAAETTF